MRLRELIRSRAYRLALIYTAVFGVSAAVLLGFVFLVAGGFVKSHVDEFVVSEMEMLRADFDIDGPPGVIGLVHERDRSDRSSHWLYLYEDAQGHRLAGDADAWPAAALPGADGFYTLPARAQGHGRIRAREAHLPDGSRLLVGLNDYAVTEMRAAMARSIGLGFGGLLLLAVGGGLFITRASLRPIESINQVTQKIMGGDLRRRVPLSGSRDEFDELGGNINAMLDRINELMQLVRGASDNIAHDLRLPLARHRARLEAALTHPPSTEDWPAFLGQSLEEVDSILATFGSLLRIANVESGTLKQSFREVNLSAIVHDAGQLFEPMAAASNKTLEVQAEDGVQLPGNRDLLFQALCNLLDNAIKYTPPGSQLMISLHREAGQACIVVSDNGPGVPADQRDKVFQRLYRLDESRSTPGSGLGLSLVRAVAQLHEGHCEIEDNQPGARLRISLPLPLTSPATGPDSPGA